MKARLLAIIIFAFGTAPALHGLAVPAQAGGGPIPTNSASADDRKQFAMQLRGNGEYTVSGALNQILEASVPAAADAVALLSNRVAAALYQKGFDQLHIVLPDGKGGADQWLAKTGSNGYTEVRSTIYCSMPDRSAKDAKLCTLKHAAAPGSGESTARANAAPPVAASADNPNSIPNTPEAREQLAKALTDQAAKQDRHTTFVVCGKNGARDSLCIVDPSAPEDGYVDHLFTGPARTRACEYQWERERGSAAIP